MSDEDLRDLRRKLQELNSTVARLDGSGVTPVFGEFAQAYLAEKLLRPLRAATKRCFENAVRMHLIPGFGGIFLDRITNALWVEWVEKEQLKEGRRLHKFFNVRKSMNEILRAALDRGYIAKLPHLDDPDVYEPVGRVVSRPEIAKLLRASRPPFRFIFCVFFKMGNRPREILRWEWSMIRWNEPGHTWLDVPARISKTERNRSIAVHPMVSRILFCRFQRNPSSIYVFPARNDDSRPSLTYSSAWATACRHSGVDAMPYDARRTVITVLLANGKSVDFLAKQLDTSPKIIHSFYLKEDKEVMEGLFR